MTWHLYEVNMSHNLPTLPPEGDPPQVHLHVRGRDEAHVAAKVAERYHNPILGITVLRDLRPYEIAEEEAKESQPVTTDA